MSYALYHLAICLATGLGVFGLALCVYGLVARLVD